MTATEELERLQRNHRHLQIGARPSRRVPFGFLQSDKTPPEDCFASEGHTYLRRNLGDAWHALEHQMSARGFCNDRHRELKYLPDVNILSLFCPAGKPSRCEHFAVKSFAGIAAPSMCRHRDGLAAAVCAMASLLKDALPRQVFIAVFAGCTILLNRVATTVLSSE